ncbi:MAG: tRNA (guanine(10)-N(2))-dimethyltransferase [Halobacteria archaeon]|nr:tRNA (guanine(10)-N(2))-dimethyltransferase [Halobacteria archaeon]
MTKVKEGKAEFDVPEDVFYNDRMVMNRDITVGVLRAREGGRDDVENVYSDVFGASGVRGIRAALETDYSVAVNDRSETAVEAVRRNLEKNGVEADVSRSDANVYLDSNRFEVVDIDPFGSPIPFADAAFRSGYQLACFTATDTAPLCGAHGSGVRRYSCHPLNTEYHPEMGLRVLIGALVRTAARHDVAATPVLSHSSDHYARTYLELDEGAKVADSALEGLGYVSHCYGCFYRSSSYGLVFDGERVCPRCGDELEVAGPLWLDAVADAGFVKSVRGELEPYMGSYERARRVLETLEDEVEVQTPTHYDHHELCGSWGATPSKIDGFVERLREAGYDASRAHYSGTAFKTDAELDDIKEVVEG